MKPTVIEVLRDMNESDYQAWKRHPVSQMLFGFLEDKTENYRQKALVDWESDALNLAEDNEIKFRVRSLRELDELKLEGIKSFYRIQGIKVDREDE